MVVHLKAKRAPGLLTPANHNKNRDLVTRVLRTFFGRARGRAGGRGRRGRGRHRLSVGRKYVGILRVTATLEVRGPA